jgi:hypothetical protein
MLRERWEVEDHMTMLEKERERGLDVGTDKALALGPTSAPRPLDSPRMIDVHRQSR